MKNHEKCKSHNLSLFFHYTTNSNSHIYKNFFLLKLVADWEKREKFIDWQIIIIINKCQWVSVFVCSLLQNGESKWAEILRDHSPWDAEGFRLKKIRVRFQGRREKTKETQLPQDGCIEPSCNSCNSFVFSGEPGTGPRFFFSLNPSPSQGEWSLKISAH